MTTYIKTFSLATDTMTQQVSNKQSIAQYNQGDVNTDTMSLTITHNNSVMDLTGATVVVVFSKPDGKIVYQDTTNGVTITNATQGQISISLNTETRAAAGTVIGAVRITYSGNQTLETEKFSFNVEASLASDQAIASNNDIQALQALIKFKSFTATANQTLFDISDVGSYTTGQNRLFIDVGGAPQGPNNYTETSTTSFTLSEAVPAGTIVNCRWFQGGGAYLGGHNLTHEVGGGDVIDVTKLLNYNEQIATPISNINSSLAAIVKHQTEWINVKQPPYNAKGDGVTDDTSAIQSAINYVQSQGGGVVYFPTGSYFVKSDSTQAQGNAGDGAPFPNGSCIVITGSNITLLGAGKDKTKIQCHASNGGVAETNYNLIDYNNTGSTKVWRGGGIGILGGTSSSPQQNITIRGIELDGTAHYTGNYNYPANTSTGDGWDITHRGIWLKPDTYLYNVTIDDCYIHGFKGELTYGVGQNVTNLILQNCKFDDSNAQATNFLNGAIKNNTIGKMPIGFEIIPYSGQTSEIKDNTLNGPFDKHGIYLRNYDTITNSTSIIVCEDNQIFNVNTGAGIFLEEAKNMFVRNNVITDCQTWGIRLSTNGNTQPRQMANVHVENNKIVHRKQSNTAGAGLSFALGSYGATRSKFINNTTEIAKDAVSGVVVYQPTYFDSGSIDNSCQFYGNHGSGATRKNYEDMVANSFLIPNTSNNNIIRYDNPPVPKFYRIDLFYRVVTACNVHIWVQYTDVSGTVQTVDMANVTSQAVGVYSPSSISVYANTGAPVYVIAAIGAANGVYVTAKLTEV